MYDIAALIAPRPMLVMAGTDDRIFPLPPVLDGYERVAGAYAALGAADRIDMAIFVVRHQIGGTTAYDFLWRWLTREP